MPDNVKNPPAIILVHGFTGFKDNYLFVRFSREMCKAGFAVLRFNFYGTDSSEGEFTDTSIKEDISDIKAAIDFFEAQPIDKNRIGLVGHSMGGMVSILTNNERVRSLVLWAPSVNLYRDLSNVFGKDIVNEIEKRGNASLPKEEWGYGWKVGKKFWDEIKEIGDVSERIKEVSVPLLIVQGDKDSIVPFSSSEKLYSLANKPKVLKKINGANHDFVNFEEKIIETTKAFFLSSLK